MPTREQDVWDVLTAGDIVVYHAGRHNEKSFGQVRTARVTGADLALNILVKGIKDTGREAIQADRIILVRRLVNGQEETIFSVV